MTKTNRVFIVLLKPRCPRINLDATTAAATM